jgi:polar amino acid transport system substrate-binding protein
MMRHSTALLALVICVSLAAIGCSSGDADGPTTTDEAAETTTTVAEEPPPACDSAAPPTVEDGKLVVATGAPAFEPWVVDDDPANGQGYESAVIYAVADQLGFSKEDVTWTRTGFDEAIAPGDKDYDLNVQQYSITPEGEQVIDFSESYYDIEHVLVGDTDGPLAGAGSLGELREAKLGAVLGTADVDLIEGRIRPTAAPQVFDDTNTAAAALRDGQVEGLVLDLPTAYTLLAVELPDASILGVLPSDDDPGQLGFVLIEDSGLTGCVDAALATLRDDGTLAALVEQWLHGAGDIPTLER